MSSGYETNNCAVFFCEHKDKKIRIDESTPVKDIIKIECFRLKLVVNMINNDETIRELMKTTEVTGKHRPKTFRDCAIKQSQQMPEFTEGGYKEIHFLFSVYEGK